MTDTVPTRIPPALRPTHRRLVRTAEGAPECVRGT
jgi:hypothetical protein